MIVTKEPSSFQADISGAPKSHTPFEVILMSKRKKAKQKLPEDLRLDPEKRLVDKFDSTSIAKFPVASPEEMGFRVLDNCAEEHMM